MSIDVEDRPETQKPETVLKRVRHELAQTQGFDVSEEGQRLDADQVTALTEFNGSRAELSSKATADLAQWGGKEALAPGVNKRYNVQAQADLRGAEPGEAIQLMNPLPAYTNPDVGEVHAAGLVRRMSVEDAANGAGIGKEQLQPYLDAASVTVYSALQNGAPVITERVIDLPGMQLHEMNVHPIGDDPNRIIDAQVVAVKK